MLLGIDIGTSSAKGVLVRADGTLVAQSVVEHEVSRPHPGWVEHDATRVWWDGFRTLVGELSVAADEPISAVGCSGIGPCLLPVDKPRRTAAPRDPLRRRHQGDRADRRAGSPLRRGRGHRAVRLAAHHPGRSARNWPGCANTSRWSTRAPRGGTWPVPTWSTGSPANTCSTTTRPASACRSTTAPSTSGSASGASRSRPAWSGRAWPGPARSSAPSPPTPRRKPACPQGIPVIAGTIDAWSESVSVGATEPGDVMLMYGTTMFIVEVLAKRASSTHLWGTVGAVPGHLQPRRRAWPPPARSPAGSPS